MENKAKQEAERIYNEFKDIIDGSVDLLGIERYFLAKKLSIKCVEEIMKYCPYLSQDNRDTVLQFRANDHEFVSYWEQVKQE